MTIRAIFRGDFTNEGLRDFLNSDQQPIIVEGEIIGYANDIHAALEMAQRHHPHLKKLKGEIVEIVCRGEIIETAGFIPWE